MKDAANGNARTLGTYIKTAQLTKKDKKRIYKRKHQDKSKTTSAIGTIIN
jgi:hypothetical protein